MILAEAEIKVKLFDMYYENAKLLYKYIELPDGETYCYKIEDFNKNSQIRINRYPLEKEVKA
jgi:hypothetical protein